MSKIKVSDILQKYGDTIKEEINVKEITSFADDFEIKKLYKPIGSKLSSKFGKDTGNIIRFGKQGNLTELEDGKIKIFDNNKNERILSKEDYEISYEGLTGDDIAVDTGIVAKLDLNISPELKKEGLAREISRFLNQMRKEVDYNVSDKISLEFFTDDDEFTNVINSYKDFLQAEALLLNIKQSKNPEGDIVSIFSYEEKNITFSLKK